MQTAIHASEHYQHPLLELEAYVNQSTNTRLTDSFRKFKEALAEPTAEISDTVLRDEPSPVAATNTFQAADRSYLAMSSLFTANVKHW